MADSEKSARLETGTLFKSRYEITGFLGEGGFATVYAGRDVEIGRDVAIKILHVFATVVDPTTHLSIVERFRQEARTSARIKHPAVVTIFDVGMTDDNHPYIIMDHLSGHDLEHELSKNGPMNLARALPLFCRCLEALAEAHRMGIVHKDLKPSNLFLTDPGTPYENISILDYGIARVTQDNDARLTSAGQILGTPRYMAPEYIDSQTVSPATDVYQMGLILTEMLTGVPVVGQETLISCIMIHAQGVEIPAKLLGTPLEPILKATVEKDPARRIQDCDTLLQRLYNTDFTSMGLPNAAAVIQTRTTTGRMQAISKEQPALQRSEVTAPPPQDKKPDKPQEPARENKPATKDVDPVKPAGGAGLKIVGALVALMLLGGVAVVGLHFAGIVAIPGLPAQADKGDKPEGEPEGKPEGEPEGKPEGPEALIKEAEAAMEKGDWDEALKALKAALKADEDDKKAKDLKKLAEQERKVEKTFEAGKEALGKGDLKEANALFDKIPKDSFYASRAKDARQGLVDEQLKGAEKALKNDDLEAALAAVALVELLDPENKDLKKLRKEMPRGGPMIAIAKGAFTRGTHKDAVADALKLCQDAGAKGERCTSRTFAGEQPDKIIGMRQPFLIDKYEVTNKQYKECVDASKCKEARYTTTCGGEDPSMRAEDHPVVCITFDDAKAYCEWADKRLPTEAEWEYAARGASPDKRLFPWGEAWEPKWTNWGEGGESDKFKWTAPVGAVPKDDSASGARDMGGNVAEWTADWFSDRFYSEDKPFDPFNDKKSRDRSVRGGHWKSGAHAARVSWRSSLNPEKFDATTGVRCARTDPKGK